MFSSIIRFLEVKIAFGYFEQLLYDAVFCKMFGICLQRGHLKKIFSFFLNRKRLLNFYPLRKDQSNAFCNKKCHWNKKLSFCKIIGIPSFWYLIVVYLWNKKENCTSLYCINSMVILANVFFLKLFINNWQDR